MRRIAKKKKKIICPRVHVWNVGHGEAIRIDLGNRSIIRDFGRCATAEPQHPGPADVSTSEQEVIQHPIIKPNVYCDAVLSHAHEDHFTGFEELFALGGKPFENTYIPWLDFSTLEALGGQLTTLSAYMYAYSIPGHKPGRSARHWLRAAPVLAGLSKALVGVMAGYVIVQWPVQGEILCPPGPRDTPAVSIPQTMKLLKQLRSLAPQNNERVDESAERLFGILRRYYGEAERSPAEDVAATESVLSSIRGLHGQAGQSRFLHCWMKYKDFIDDHSLVVRIGNLFLLSDLNKRYISQMCAQYHGPARAYRLVKCSHHGTKYAPDLANYVSSADTVLHCCGRANPSYTGPSQDYDALHPGHTLCTDWWVGGPKWINRPPQYHLFTQKHQVV